MDSLNHLRPNFFKYWAHRGRKQGEEEEEEEEEKEEGEGEEEEEGDRDNQQMEELWYLRSIHSSKSFSALSPIGPDELLSIVAMIRDI